MSVFYKIFWISLLFKLVLAYFLPLLPDEAYYWVWSHHLQLSYYDHPPMIAWLFRMGHFFEPFGHAIRFPAVIFLHLALITWKEIFNQLKLPTEALHRFLILILLVPYLGFGSVILTPDLPLMFFWPLSFYFFIRILQNSKWSDYALLGTSLGLGFLSKYHIVLFLICAVIYLTCEKKWNVIRWKYVGLTIILGFIFSLPVIAWNVGNNFLSFAFQLKHGLKADHWNWMWPVEYTVGQMFMLIPPLLFYFFKNRKVELLKPFYYFTVVVLGFFLLTSFRSSVEMNWTLMAFPTFFALVAVIDIPKRTFRSVLSILAVFNIFLIGSMFSGHYLHGKIFEPFFFESQKGKVEKHKPLYGINYQISSSLWYFSKTPVYKLEDASRFDFFDTLKMKRPEEKVFYVFKEKTNEYPDWIYKLTPKIEIVELLDRDYVIEKLEFE